MRDGNNVDYDIDNLSNRYDSVDGNTLAYDAAGNLTTDKDGYQYEYDYENRITKIIKSGPTTVAEFAYDALGRRIKKRDSIANTNNIYYYNDNWQILCDYNDTGAGGTPERWFAYGNYIDEVVLMSKSFTSWLSARYYIHDHLYSPAALMGSTGSAPIERYEYDAYGNCQIMDASYNPRSSSLYGNPYYFTGRELDFLDGGNLKIQYNRDRYYDYYTGRWLTHDPLGYVDGMNLYEYARSNPLRILDPFGAACKVVFDCVLSKERLSADCCTRDCYYRCRETRREEKGGGDLSCDDVPKPMFTEDSKRHSSWWCGKTYGLIGCPGKCKESYGYVRLYYTTREYPSRKCSKTACRNVCDGAKKTESGLCGKIKDPKKRALCEVATAAAKGACYLWCDSWCTEP